MKYDKHHIKLFTDALAEGQGRVRACKIADIDYQTFLNWLHDENKLEFVEAVKKAEMQGNDKLRDLSIRKIVEDKSWQSGAWWLERNFFNEFGNKQKLDLSGEIKTDTPTINLILDGKKLNVSTDKKV